MSRERPKRATLPPAKENIEKLAKVVKDGDYYGAQQMYKSFSARYISAERYLEALDILQSGACLQLENGQITCGAELAVLFVETLVKGKRPYDEDSLGIIRKIYKKFPRVSVPQHVDLEDDDDMERLSDVFAAAKVRVDACSSFLKAAIKWSSEFGERKTGSPEIHDMLADYLYTESPEVDIARVSLHFVRGSNTKKFASTLVSFMGKCYPGEDELAIARAILMYLSLGNLRDANNLMDELKKQLQLKEIDIPESELIRFIDYLLLTLQRDALPLFNMLKQSYKSELERDPMLSELLDNIAEKFYRVRRQNPLQGMFGDFFKMMGGE